MINRSQAEIIERIFNDCISGKGTFLIAKELQSEGVRTIAGGNWQSSTYINEGKNSCSGTVIEDDVIGRMNIRNKTVVEEVMKNGQKHYRYTIKSQ